MVYGVQYPLTSDPLFMIPAVLEGIFPSYGFGVSGKTLVVLRRFDHGSAVFS